MQLFGQNPIAPFGSRGLVPAVLTAQRLVSTCEAGKPAHKWQTFRQICEAKTMLGLSDRALVVLDALLSFHPDTVLTSGSADLVVFPSNRQLAQRAHGMAPSTLRRHIAVLVGRGLVLRRDSANGKRFARKTGAGEIEQAFGFDLGPLIARAEEFERLARSVHERRRALEARRHTVSLARRDIVKMIAAGLEAGISADWPGFHRRYQEIVARVPRAPSLEDLGVIAAKLDALGQEILTLLEAALPVDPVPDTLPPAGRETTVRMVAQETKRVETEILADQGTRTAVSPRRVPLALVLSACPDITDYAREGIRDPRELVGAAAIVRPMLGISPSAWDEACETMGPEPAAIVVAAILQRGTAIKSPGGYLRSLTRRAAAGQFSIWPMVMALNTVRLQAGSPAPS